MERGWREAPLEERTHAVLELAEKTARDASKITPEDLEPARAAGLDDAGIFDIVAVVGVFSLFNVVAEALGIDNEPDWD